jgi:iron complex outermembrane recepter protein
MINKQKLLFCIGILVISINLAFANDEDLLDLSLEELMEIEVTSASKKSQHLTDAPAAIFVIKQEDIKRSGATSIPDALRMAPGLDVGRIDSNKWAVSSRGFNGRFANKLLVLIDGRSIYTQAFSGIYWENQDVLLEDVDRIEVIRGPGAALWGANAVNGVINIITKHSKETKGGLLTAGGGSQELGFGSLRYGAQLGTDTTGRAYAKGFKRGQFKHVVGDNANDDWDKVQGGFRIDSALTPEDKLTVWGDAYYSKINQSLTFASINSPTFFQTFDETTHASGANINSRLQHTISPTSSYALQLYYDIYKRNEVIDKETRQTADIDFQHRFALNDWNDVIWGLNYRYMDAVSTLPSPEVFSIRKTNRKDQYFSAFLQDEMALIDNKLSLTLGSKFEHNDYSGFEIQPTARLLWTPHEQHRFWGGISRAVRTPSYVDAELTLVGQFVPPNSVQNPTPFPVAATVKGTPNFNAEELLSYELGYRFNLDRSISIDATAFFNDYSSLRSLKPGLARFNGRYLVQPLNVTNLNKGETFGFETAVSWKMLDWWRWDVNYSYLNTRLKSNQFYQEGVSPQHKTSIRSVITPWKTVNLDFWLRYADESTFFTVRGPVKIDSYVTLDVRLAWRPLADIELSVTGQNLLDNGHLEAVDELFTRQTEIPRSVFGKIAWNF